MLPLIGILIVVVGFALRLNPLLVVAAAAVAIGLAAGHALLDVIAAFGKAFVDTRSVAVVWMALPVIGLLERAGLKERARTMISGIQVATAGRLLLACLAVRQVTSALGLTSLGGHPQSVSVDRPNGRGGGGERARRADRRGAPADSRPRRRGGQHGLVLR